MIAKRLFLVMLMCMSLFDAKAQQTEWYMEADTSKILIGQQIQIKLRAVVPNDAEAIWPNFSDTLNAAEVLNRSGVDSTETGSEWLLEERVTVTVWDSGYYVIQPLALVVNGDSIMSDPVFLTVNTVKSLAEAPYDIKAPEEAPKTLGEWIAQLWPYLLGAVVFALAIWRWMKKRPHRAVDEVEAPNIDPYEQAIQELGQLRESKLWQSGEVKEYYDTLTDIGRRYLEFERGIPALERTTDETRALLDQESVLSELKGDFIALMQEADMVKFAKERFDDEACEGAFRRARLFIDGVHEITLKENKETES